MSNQTRSQTRARGAGPETTEPELVQLYADIAAHTKPECSNTCRVPNSCCSPFHCQVAEDTMAKAGVSVDKPNIYPRAPYVGEGGCVVPPHFRPLCAVHACAVSALGFKPNDEPWTDEYFRLYDRINYLEEQKLRRQMACQETEST